MYTVVTLIESVFIFLHEHVLQDVEVSNSFSELANSDGPSGEQDSVPVHAIVVDASTFNFIDTQGVNTLLQVSHKNWQVSRCSTGFSERFC